MPGAEVERDGMRGFSLSSSASKARSVLQALASHVNALARSRPHAFKLSRSCAFVNTSAIRFAISQGWCGSKSASLRSIISGMLVRSEPITGAPLAIASRIGSPKPS